MSQSKLICESPNADSGCLPVFNIFSGKTEGVIPKPMPRKPIFLEHSHVTTSLKTPNAVKKEDAGVQRAGIWPSKTPIGTRSQNQLKQELTASLMIPDEAMDFASQPLCGSVPMLMPRNYPRIIEAPLVYPVESSSHTRIGDNGREDLDSKICFTDLAEAGEAISESHLPYLDVDGETPCGNPLPICLPMKLTSPRILSSRNNCQSVHFIPEPELVVHQSNRSLCFP